MKRRMTTIPATILLASALFASQAEAHGGGGFYGSGRSDGFSKGGGYPSIGDGKFGRHQNAFHHIKSNPSDVMTYGDDGYPSHRR
jgi:hypothetical protein